MVSDDENSQDATGDAFDLLHFLARKRLARGLLTVVDATNVRPEDRRGLVELAREFHCLPVAIVMDVPERVCHERNSTRPDRSFGPHVIRNQRIAMRRNIRDLEREGFRHVYFVRTPEEAEAATLAREPLWNNLRHVTGPFDIVGDVHGCYGGALELLGKLGYVKEKRGAGEEEKRGRMGLNGWQAGESRRLEKLSHGRAAMRRLLVCRANPTPALPPGGRGVGCTPPGVS